MRVAKVAVVLLALSLPLMAQEAPNLIIGGEAERGVELVNPIAVLVAGTRIIIMESTAPHLRVLSSSGQLIRTLGRSGQGPGELQRPLALLYDSASARLLVVDRQRVTYYTMQDTLALVTTHRLPLSPSAACLSRGRLWISRRNAQGLLHEVVRSGDELATARSLGTVRPSEVSDFRSQLASAGPLLCDQAGTTAFLVSRLFGEVRLVSFGSATAKLYQLPGFVAPELRSGDDVRRTNRVLASEKGVRLELPDNGEYDEVVGAIISARGARIIVGRKTPAQTRSDEYASFRVYAIDAASAATPVATGQWRPIGDSNAGVFCYSQEPVPIIARFASGRCPAK